MERINKDQIVSINIRGFEEDIWYEYVCKPKITFGGFTIRKEVRVFSAGLPYVLPEYKTEEEFLKNYKGGNVIVKNNKVYIKPNIKFEMSNNETYCKYFNSIEERDEYYEKNLKHLNLLEL